jgi:hypothetical protein
MSFEHDELSRHVWFRIGIAVGLLLATAMEVAIHIFHAARCLP